jgi:hypothetical protein
LFFSCYGSVAALPALANCNEHRGAAGNGLGNTIKDLRQTTSGAAGNGLGTTIKYLNKQRAAPRATALKPPSNTCLAPRAPAWAP